ncbi:ABC transporter ATP-binding protein [Liquorilactobacillus satsumensis]|uniref:ABC transporter ATP-binding protein n=1 Tax=Liquorilactobacillus satsumensis TaxID=259059 RepID=UPI0021C32BB1|nr:ABC transporter ATP-binding protein [Liquorilactobacillus satsumensis]MCP9312927.1 ABC transporter ATP-binding protein [Liquorilactobacillus satsumensis]MCP9360039.1 ABC transporter ATP-binding protein [Liquorilactobacillus satsumensis]
MDILKPHFKQNVGMIIGAVIAVVILAASSLWQPRLLQDIMNAIIADRKERVLVYGIQLIVLALIGIAAGIASTFFAAKVAQAVATDLRAQTYQKIQTFSFGNIERFSAGSLVVRLINDINQVLNLVMMLLTQLLRLPILFLGAFILGILTIPRLWWIELLMVVLVLGLTSLVFSRMSNLFMRFQKWVDNLNSVAKESMQGIRVIKSFNQEQSEIKKFAGAAGELRGLNLTIGYLFALLIPCFMLISNLMILLAVYLVGTGITAHPGELAAIASYISYLMQLMLAIIIGAMTMTMSSRGMISLRRIKEVLKTKPDVQFDPKAPVQDLAGSVEFKQVTFSYPGAKTPALRAVSFKVKAGNFVGIVGSTGSGKSTLAQLMARLYDPSAGEVEIGGQNLRKVNEKSLRKAVSFVLQKAILFSGSIADNLKQGKADATEKELSWAANIAQATEFVEKYTEGFAHHVEERSSNYSGGQKQRLSIARGVVGRPNILILDDSTSALDAKSEKLVQEALAHELTQTTVFMIAEKISSVIKADQILVLDQGKLVGSGTHSQLLQDSQIYREIYAAQLSKTKKG